MSVVIQGITALRRCEIELWDFDAWSGTKSAAGNILCDSSYQLMEGNSNFKPSRGVVTHMTEEKTKRALRRMRRRKASNRRRRLEHLRAETGDNGRPLALRSIARAAHDVDGNSRSDGIRVPTRQELRVQAELALATRELGLA
jgi:hypothetical protein